MALIVGVFLACNGIRQDEFTCESAVSHLQQCCTGFSGSSIDCTYVPPNGCDTSAVYPDLNFDQASCIRDESCETLQASGVCARVAAATTQDQLEVCP